MESCSSAAAGRDGKHDQADARRSDSAAVARLDDNVESGGATVRTPSRPRSSPPCVALCSAADDLLADACLSARTAHASPSLLERSDPFVNPPPSCSVPTSPALASRGQRRANRSAFNDAENSAPALLVSCANDLGDDLAGILCVDGGDAPADVHVTVHDDARVKQLSGAVREEVRGALADSLMRLFLCRSMHVGAAREQSKRLAAVQHIEEAAFAAWSQECEASSSQAAACAKYVQQCVRGVAHAAFVYGSRVLQQQREAHDALAAEIDRVEAELAALRPSHGISVARDSAPHHTRRRSSAPERPAPTSSDSPLNPQGPSTNTHWRVPPSDSADCDAAPWSASAEGEAIIERLRAQLAAIVCPTPVCDEAADACSSGGEAAPPEMGTLAPEVSELEYGRPRPRRLRASGSMRCSSSTSSIHEAHGASAAAQPHWTSLSQSLCCSGLDQLASAGPGTTHADAAATAVPAASCAGGEPKNASVWADLSCTHMSSALPEFSRDVAAVDPSIRRSAEVVCTPYDASARRSRAHCASAGGQSCELCSCEGSAAAMQPSGAAASLMGEGYDAQPSALPEACPPYTLTTIEVGPPSPSGVQSLDEANDAGLLGSSLSILTTTATQPCASTAVHSLLDVASLNSSATFSTRATSPTASISLHSHLCPCNAHEVSISGCVTACEGHPQAGAAHASADADAADSVWGWLQPGSPLLPHILLRGKGVAVGSGRQVEARSALPVGPSEGPLPLSRADALFLSINKRDIDFVAVPDATMAPVHFAVTLEAANPTAPSDRGARAVLESFSQRGVAVNSTWAATRATIPLKSGDRLIVSNGSALRIMNQFYTFHEGDPTATILQLSCPVDLSGAPVSVPLCHLCERDPVSCVELQPCRHVFCAACLSHHFASLVVHGKPIECPCHCGCPTRIVVATEVRAAQRTRLGADSRSPELEAAPLAAAADPFRAWLPNSAAQNRDAREPDWVRATEALRRQHSAVSPPPSAADMLWQRSPGASPARGTPDAGGSPTAVPNISRRLALNQVTPAPAPHVAGADAWPTRTASAASSPARSPPAQRARTCIHPLVPLMDEVLPLNVDALKGQQLEVALRVIKDPTAPPSAAADHLLAVARLAWTESTMLEELSSLSTIEDVVACMQAFPRSAAVQCRAATVLWALVKGDGDVSQGNQWRAARCAAVETVVSAMEGFRRDSQVQLNALQCLAPLCHGNAMMKAHISQVALKTVMDVLQQHMDDASIQQKGCILLATLQVGGDSVLNDGIRLRMLEAGVPRHLQRVLRNHAATEDTLWAAVFCVVAMLQPGRHVRGRVGPSLVAANVLPTLKQAVLTHAELCRTQGLHSDELTILLASLAARTLEAARGQRRKNRVARALMLLGGSLYVAHFCNVASDIKRSQTRQQ